MSEYEISSDWYYKKYYEAYDEPENSGDDFDDFDPFGEDEIEKEEVARAFESIPKHGVHAHAFKGGLDNLKMKKLREEGLTYRAIAKQVGCSPSTVRNRLKKMGEK